MWEHGITLRFFSLHACSTGQGYFFAKPMAAHETNELLRTMRGAAPVTTGPNLEIVRVS